MFPLSNWTELDIWRYIELESLELPSIYFAHRRDVFERDGILLAVSEYGRTEGRREVERRMGALPHGRRSHDHRCGAVARDDYRRRHREISAATVSERGETRADDRTSAAAMEDRKREGYF